MMKRSRVFALAMCACLGGAAVLPIAAGAASRFRVTLSDLVQAANYVNGTGTLTETQLKEYDLTGDGKITLTDLVRLARLYTEQMSGGRPEVSTSPVPPSTGPVSTMVPSQRPITEQEAVVMALAEVPGAGQENIVSSKLDFSSSAMSDVYEIEIRYNGAEYDFEITTSGQIWKKSMEKKPASGYPGSPQTADSAKQLVLARVPGAAVSDFTEFREDMEDGVATYEGELRYEGVEYDFTIVASTGEFIAWSEEKYYRPVPMPTEPASSGSPAATATPTSGPALPGISAQEAVEIALAEVPGASSSDIVTCESDYSDAAMSRVYEIEIRYNGTEYDFEITTSGQIWKKSMEKKPASGYPGSPQTADSAKQLVLARVPGAAVSDFTEFREDMEDGVATYEGELRYEGVEYDFTIVASTGEFIAWSEEKYYRPVPMPTEPASSGPPAATATPTSGPALPGISAQEAVEIALAEVPGASSSDIVTCESDYSDAAMSRVYEIEIRYNGTEYDFEITTSGEIWKKSMEKRPASDYPGSPQTADSAKQLVLARIPGASMSNFTDFEQDSEGGLLVYEGEVRYNGIEYEFTIVAATGEFISWSEEKLR